MLVSPQYERFSYQRRVPEQELLHQVFVEHLETFLDRAALSTQTLIFTIYRSTGCTHYDKGDDRPVFVPAPELEDEDVKTIVDTTAHRVIRLLARRGILDQLDPLAEESPILAGVTAASVQSMIATGERAGMRVRRVLDY